MLGIISRAANSLLGKGGTAALGAVTQWNQMSSTANAISQENNTRNVDKYTTQSNNANAWKKAFAVQAAQEHDLMVGMNNETQSATKKMQF